MFRATMCPSSGEKLYLCDTWYLSLCLDDCVVCVPHSHPHRVINTKCRIAQFFLVFLFLFSTCFGRLCAHHQEKNCIYATLRICHSVWMTVLYAYHTVIHTEWQIPSVALHNFFSIFISFLYMFPATMCPSSGEITVSMYITQSSTQSDKYQVSHRYNFFS